MNRRNPKYIAALQARLDRLWPRRQPQLVADLPGRWPVLPAATLWAFQYAGLRHLIRRGDALAERWLIALEESVSLAAGTLLTRTPGRDLAVERRRVLDMFSQLDTNTGKLKTSPEAWDAIDDDVRYIARELGGLLARGPAWRDRTPAAREAAIARWWRALHFGAPPFALTGVHVNNISVALLTSAGRAAEEWVAIERRKDPSQMSDGLRKWRRRSGTPAKAE